MFRCLPILFFCLSLSACQTLSFNKNKAENQESENGAVVGTASPGAVTLPIGIVEHVDAGAGFVLIRSRRGLQLEPGTMLTLHGGIDEPGATASVSPARKGVFLTADILQGVAQKGQQVTMEHSMVTEGSLAGAPLFEDRNAIQVLE